MRTGYLRGFYRFELNITTEEFGTFVFVVWARTLDHAVMAAHKRHPGCVLNEAKKSPCQN